MALSVAMAICIPLLATAYAIGAAVRNKGSMHVTSTLVIVGATFCAVILDFHIWELLGSPLVSEPFGGLIFYQAIAAIVQVIAWIAGMVCYHDSNKF